MGLAETSNYLGEGARLFGMLTKCSYGAKWDGLVLSDVHQDAVARRREGWEGSGASCGPCVEDLSSNIESKWSSGRSFARFGDSTC